MYIDTDVQKWMKVAIVMCIYICALVSPSELAYRPVLESELLKFPHPAVTILEDQTETPTHQQLTGRTKIVKS